MAKFVISPHFRLQEWVAEEKGYFRDEGLDYEFRDSWGRAMRPRTTRRPTSRAPTRHSSRAGPATSAAPATGP